MVGLEKEGGRKYNGKIKRASVIGYRLSIIHSPAEFNG
jgi:hypothetical protein